jgi:hypothetical protein
VDQFWIAPQQTNMQKQLPPLTTTYACASIPTKPTTTKEQRHSSILSKCQVLAQLASQTVSETEEVVEIINGLVTKLSIHHGLGKEYKSGINGREDQNHRASTMELISNPPIQQKQNQARKQPSAIGAPTTSSHKAAGYQSKRIKKATEKARDAKALGR